MRPEQISKAFKEQQHRHKARPRDIACTLLGFRSASGNPDDPLLFKYVEILLKEGYFSSSDLLAALLRFSTYGKAQGTAPTTHLTPTCEERIFIIVGQHYATNDIPTDAVRLQELVQIITRWLKQASEDAISKQMQGIQSLDVLINSMYDALGALVGHVLGNNGIRVVMKQKWWEERRATVVEAMQNYDTHVLQWYNSQFSTQLQKMTDMPPYIEMDSQGRPKFSDQQVLLRIAEVPVNTSRAGMFIWLTAALAARPLTDDMSLLSHLQGRYPNDAQSLVGDLLLGSFDVLVNTMLTKEPRQNVKAVRSFICNKLPLLLSMMSSTIQPAAVEACVQMAMGPGGMVSMDPLPPISPGATDVRDTLKATRLDLLQACVLHGLITESTVTLVLNENIALPRVPKLSKESLIAQCSNNMTKFGEWVEELAGMQGNAGAIAGCIVETINNLCMSKDTMSLKTACDKLVKRIPYMDFLMQYTQPGMLLLPLCNLLNDWVHDQDQTEFTPTYEEFASILLFTLAVIYRHDLSYADIGILGDSFVARLLDDKTTSKTPAELSGEQSSQLAKWIEGLFAVDEHGETSGIGDEVMRQCSPQSFYTLVPTLFEQSILASRSGALTMKTFNGGLELLLEPFLLPSLIMGLGWLAKHSWEDHDDAAILIQVLEKLLKPSSSSQDTQAMHRAVLAMIATPLSSSLEEYSQQQGGGNKTVVSLLELLKPHLNQQRSLSYRKAEIDGWLQSGATLQSQVQQSIRELISWAALPSSPPNPPPRYNHRTFVVACDLLEGQVMLSAMTQEINRNGFADMPVALDVCTSLVCAPTPLPMGSQQSANSHSPTARLRNHLRVVSSDVKGLLQRPESEAETLVRIGRRVEAQLAYTTQVPSMAMSMPMPEQAADQMMQDLGLDLGDSANGTGVANSQNVDIPGLDDQIDLSTINNATEEDLVKMASESGPMNLDQNTNMFLDLGLNPNNQQPNTGQSMDLGNQEEDIFAGLDMNGVDMNIDDFNF